MSHGTSCFNWEQYISLAEKILDSDDISSLKEAAQRAAISRAYYGAYCLARNLAINNNWVTNSTDKNMHSKVINFYINSTEKIKRDIGTNLRRLRKDRNDVDYEDYCPKANEKYSKKCIEIAKIIKNNIIELEKLINNTGTTA